MPQPTHRDSEDTPRVMTSLGRVAHNVMTDENGQVPKHGACQFCHYRPNPAGDGWKGTANDRERNRVLRLPYCKEQE